MTPTRIAASAPGRVCLFGEHQDYLGLPVVASAIDLRLRIEGVPTADGVFTIDMPDIGSTATIDPTEDQAYQGPRDYLRSSVNILRRAGFRWSTGYRATVRGAIPINAGTSSSSAMVVMWLRFLLAVSDRPIDPDPGELARWGHAAEVVEFGEPGGMMDHYCAALGGVVAIDTVAPYGAQRLPVDLAGIVLGNSLQPKATVETLGRARSQVREAVSQIRAHLPGFDLAATPLAEALGPLSRVDPEPARRLRANLANRDITPLGRQALVEGRAEDLGQLLLAHHAELRDGLDLSTAKIERMLDASMAAGALGGKINGSGGGGCMFAYAPGREGAVADAIRREGGVPYITRVAGGARLE